LPTRYDLQVRPPFEFFDHTGFPARFEEAAIPAKAPLLACHVGSWISMFAAGAIVALSIFFVFRPHHPLSGIQPPRQALAATGCVDRPETSAIPAEYSCEKP